MDAACHPEGWVGLQGTHGDIQVPPYGARKESVKVDVGMFWKVTEVAGVEICQKVARGERCEGKGMRKERGWGSPGLSEALCMGQLLGSGAEHEAAVRVHTH